jgi:radical SAM protein with 4Fe4S-binding SPASM domain
VCSSDLPCHRFCNPETDAAYKLGNIAAGGLTNHALEKQLREFNPAVGMKDRCAECPAVNSCAGFCLHEAMVDGQALFTPASHHCETFRLFYAEALRAHSILTAEQNQLYLNRYRPRPQRPPLVPLTAGPNRPAQPTTSPRTIVLGPRQRSK